MDKLFRCIDAIEFKEIENLSDNEGLNLPNLQF